MSVDSCFFSFSFFFPVIKSICYKCWHLVLAKRKLTLIVRFSTCEAQNVFQVLVIMHPWMFLIPHFCWKYTFWVFVCLGGKIISVGWYASVNCDIFCRNASLASTASSLNLECPSAFAGLQAVVLSRLLSGGDSVSTQSWAFSSRPASLSKISMGVSLLLASMSKL